MTQENETLLVDVIANMIRAGTNRTAAGILAKDILAKAKSMIRADEREKVLREVGELICILVGSTMSEDTEAGRILGDQLRPIMGFLKSGK